MTREEKIEMLETEKAYMIAHGGDRQAEALTSAIKALEQEPCEDAISRKRVMAEYCMREGVSKKSFVDIINDLPPVNPQTKTGHWIYDDECKEHGHCDICGFKTDLVDGKPHDYCPNCGARMVEPQEGSDKE